MKNCLLKIGFLMIGNWSGLDFGPKHPIQTKSHNVFSPLIWATITRLAVDKVGLNKDSDCAQKTPNRCQIATFFVVFNNSVYIYMLCCCGGCCDSLPVLLCNNRAN